MQIGVSSYSYSLLVGGGPGQMSIFDVVARAKEMKFEAIEFAGIPVRSGENTEAVAARLREVCEQNGLPIASYTVGGDLLNGSGGNQTTEIERLKGEVRIAKLLRVPVMRHDAAYGPGKGSRGFGDSLPLLAKGCRAVTEYAADLDVRTAVENHGFFCQDSERVEQLVLAVNHANFGVLLDAGNFLCADESPVTAVARLMPYVFHVHVKDFHVKPGNGPNPGSGWFGSRAGNYLRGSIIGHGEVPVLQCLRIIKEAGYTGVLSVEFEGMEDPITGIATGRDNLARYLQSI